MSQKWNHLKGLQFPQVGMNKKVDMLIGLDYPNLHSALYEVHGNVGEPIARLTPLGWTCVGNIDKDTHTSLFSTYFVNQTSKLDELTKEFWAMDSYGTKKHEKDLTPVETRVLRQTTESITCENNHYEVGIPWKESKNEIPNNYEMAEKRLQKLNSKLKKSPDVETAYSETIDNYIEKGYLRKVPIEEEKPENRWYLPHFPVVKPDRETTKVRIVFDAAAKYKGVCLNDFIHTGPKLQNELFDVLLRFRKNEVAVVCDISEMYLRVGIHETDRRFHRLLWDESEYEFNTLVFGVNASPFLAQLVAQTNAKQHRNDYPMAAETVLYCTYMDDSMESVNTETQGIELYHQLSELWLKAGMCARKWLSNSRTVLEHIPERDRASKVNLDTSYLPTTKALGVTWIAENDLFTFTTNEKDSTLNTVTKRNLLKREASLFDPHRFISPYIVRGKMLLQQC